MMKTWKIEAFIIFSVLLIQLFFTGFGFGEIICSIAVYITFLHCQVADRMQERQAILSVPDVECHHKLNKYFIAKELLWVTFFAINKNYAALSGAILFSIYPIWRKYYRKIKPIN